METYAIVTAGGRQFRVTTGMVLDVDRLAEKPGKKVTLGPVLAGRGKGGFEVGRPELKGAKVMAEVVGPVRGKKVISYKFKRRKGYHRKIGHRQDLTRLKITEIKLNGA
ncbi:MAG: 50S ribosomal protein L21 [Candidatus Omnitrophica bacterium CG11_big_fil_rev_8_21_14_0_20_64_10]|nr:MAG: 50S ribosomal protein L21 [Candidatus Omnitrophica bacterium CG11_big_fil_rev_8_21_14_0_20_64_10]